MQSDGGQLPPLAPRAYGPPAAANRRRPAAPAYPRPLCFTCRAKPDSFLRAYLGLTCTSCGSLQAPS